MRGSDWYVWGRVRQGTSHVFYFRSVRCLARDYRQGGAPRRPQRLTPWSCWKKPRRAGPSVGVHQHDIGITCRPPVLKGVIENDCIDSLGDRLPNPTNAISRCDDRHAFVQSLMNDDFIPAVTPEDDTRNDAPRGKSARYPGRNGRLASPPNGEIPYADDGY